MGNRLTKTKTKTRYIKGWNVERKETETKTQSNVVGTTFDMKQVTTTMGNCLTKTKAKTKNKKGSFEKNEVREMQDEEQRNVVGTTSDINQIKPAGIVEPEGRKMQSKDDGEFVGNPFGINQIEAVDIVEREGREMQAGDETTIIVGKPSDMNQIEEPTIESRNNEIASDNEVVPRETNWYMRSSNTDNGNNTDQTCATAAPAINVTGTLNIYSGDHQQIIQGDQFNQTSQLPGHERTDTKLEPPAITTKGGDKYLQVIKERLATLYRERYCHLPTMVDETRDTDEMFMKPELALKTPCDSQKTVSLTCDDLLSLKTDNQETIKNHVVLVGSPGSGKSTIVHNELAYKWGKGVKNSQINLLFVIDMCKVEHGSDVFAVIEDQLLRGEEREKFEKLMKDNAQSTAFLLDGFDEVSQNSVGRGKGKSLSALLDGTWLSGCRVIVTTRQEKFKDFNRRYPGYIEVDLLGFSDATTLDFIEKEVRKLRSRASAANCKRAVANLSPALSWLSKNPLTLSMLCVLWKDDGQLPTGITSLYRNVVEFMMERSYSSDTDYMEAIPNIEHVLQCVGKFALQNLSGQKVMAGEVPAEYLQVSRRIGICTTHKERERFRQKEFLAFPLHRSFQEFCAATYLADIANTNHDQFISAITPVVDNKNLLQFCCGLSLTAASTILQHIVSTTTVNVENKDVCIFGVGPRVANPWKLPLLLLFEAESQMSEDSVKTSSPELHAYLSPLVENIRMNHANWPADNEMCHLIQYFISKKG
ncbi:uncharacterized protein [Amphiura filiformis]|uniref:uncharacterized protein n=1 Tax=Amphiura filiformis TaxID=82378 RepID=UPI003B222C5D